MSDKKTSQVDSLLAKTDKQEEKKEKAQEEAAAKKPDERTQADKDRSFSFVLGYAKRECCSISIGMFFLIGGSSGELALPAFIGIVIDLLAEGDYETIQTYCLYMLILIIVSQSSNLSNQVFSRATSTLSRILTKRAFFISSLESVWVCEPPSTTF